MNMMTAQVSMRRCCVKNYQIVGEQILYEQGCFRRIKFWIKGWVNIPNGQTIWGWSGKETVVVITQIKPTVIVGVTK